MRDNSKHSYKFHIRASDTLYANGTNVVDALKTCWDSKSMISCCVDEVTVDIHDEKGNLIEENVVVPIDCWMNIN